MQDREEVAAVPVVRLRVIGTDAVGVFLPAVACARHDPQDGQIGAGMPVEPSHQFAESCFGCHRTRFVHHSARPPELGDQDGLTTGMDVTAGPLQPAQPRLRADHLLQ